MSPPEPKLKLAFIASAATVVAVSLMAGLCWVVVATDGMALLVVGVTCGVVGLVGLFWLTAYDYARQGYWTGYYARKNTPPSVPPWAPQPSNPNNPSQPIHGKARRA